MIDVPTNEPLSLRAGDTWRWTKSLGDYPAPTWTLTYHFRARAEKRDVIATASGADHAFEVDAASSAKWSPDVYTWTAQATDGTEVVTVDQGRLEVLRDMAVADGFDARTPSERTLAAITAVIEGRATKDQESYSISGRSLSRTPLADLVEFEKTYRSRVATELRKEAARAGRPSHKNVLVRF